MRPPLEVRTNRGYGWRLACLGLGGALCGLPMLVDGLLKLDGPHGGTGVLLGGGFLALTLAGVAFVQLTRRGHVRRFDEHGVTLRSGRKFAWSDFVEVRTVYLKRDVVNHYTLVFKNGTAQVFFVPAENAGEIIEVIGALRSRVNPWASPS